MTQVEHSVPMCTQTRRNRRLAKWVFSCILISSAMLWHLNRGEETSRLPFVNSFSRLDNFRWSQVSRLILISNRELTLSDYPNRKFGIYIMLWYLSMCAPERAYGLEFNKLDRISSCNCHYEDSCSCGCDGPPIWRSDFAQSWLDASSFQISFTMLGSVCSDTLAGGPGGSGVELIFSDGANITKVVNPLSSSETYSEGKYFDLISFDPRGVNNTTPRLSCFSDSSSYDVWKYQEEADGLDRTSDVSLSLAWARGKALMETCARDNEISKHMNTVPVARDMIEIIERHGEWRSRQAELWLASKEGKSITAGKKMGDLYSHGSVIERTKWHRGDEKLQYWGFSYGTLLGQTFAAMYPTRVRRMVLDGVGDSRDYYSTSWMLGLKDTDKIMLKFFEYCSAAGPEKCALNTGNSTPSEIQDPVESLISSLHQHPTAVPGNGTRGPEIITYTDVMMMVRTLIYRPLDYFPEMAELLADLLYGNGSALADYKQKAHKRTCPFSDSSAKDENDDRSSCQLTSGVSEVTRVILCSDGLDITNTTKEDFKVKIEALYQQSHWLGEFWGTITLPCVHWRERPKWSITAGKRLQISQIMNPN